MSRKKKKAAVNLDEDVDHHRPTLERENELLIAENIRLLKKIKELEALIEETQMGDDA